MDNLAINDQPKALSQYSRHQIDRTYADQYESVLGHLICERGRSVKAALEDLRPIVSQTRRETLSAVDWCQKLGFGGLGVGILVGAGMGMGFAILPILAGTISIKFWADSRSELPRRDAEYHLLKTTPNLPEALYALHLRGVTAVKIVGAYDQLVAAIEARLEGNGEFTEAEVGEFLQVKVSGDMGLETSIPATASTENQTQSGIQNQASMDGSRTESVALAPTELQPIAIAQDATTAALPSSTSVKPGDSIGLDLAAVLLAMPEFCHILLAGENGTGKTTFAMALLKPIINKFIQITGFELLLIDPKRSRWNGLFQTKSYQSAFSNQPHDLERSVNRLELIYFKLDKLSSDRQKTGKRTEVPTLVIIDEVNTWLDALKAFDRNFKEENSSLPPAERSPAPRLYNRAVDSIAGISRMGREDRVWLWLIGQNSNLEALGLSGAQDRANFSIVAVGLGDNQITIELALSNSTMFTRGQALKNALKEHQGKPYQIAACTRKPANLLIMPSSYKDNAQEDFSAEILARLGSTGTTPIAPSPSAPETRSPQQSSDEWDGIPEVEIDGPDSDQWDLIQRFSEETGQGYFNNPNFDLWLKKQTYVDGKAVRVSSGSAPGRALPGQTIEVETTAIDERPEGLDDFPLVLTIWEYLDGNDARSMKQIRDYVRLKDRMPEEVLRAKIPTMENFNDGVKAVVSFGVSQGFLREVSGDSFESIRKH